MAIDLYSKATTDTLLAGKLSDAPSDGSTYGRKDGAWEVVSGGGGSYLPLSGGTMTGAIVFDGTSGQYISKGNFDSSRGGNYGISLVCSIGYEFNWQAGWLTTTEQGSTTPRPLYLDSAAGTTLRVWDSGTSTGTEVTHSGITFSDSTVQTTAYTGGIPTAQKTKVNMYTSNAYFDGSYLRVYVGVSDITSNFSSGGRWFGTVYSSTFNPVNSVGNATDSTGRPYAQVSCVGAGGGIDSGTPLYYTEDGGTTWTSADLPIY
jgi:hypothetical protein